MFSSKSRGVENVPADFGFFFGQTSATHACCACQARKTDPSVVVHPKTSRGVETVPSDVGLFLGQAGAVNAVRMTNS
jgi:hypothetical protein